MNSIQEQQAKGGGWAKAKAISVDKFYCIRKAWRHLKTHLLQATPKPGCPQKISYQALHCFCICIIEESHILKCIHLSIKIQLQSRTKYCTFGSFSTCPYCRLSLLSKWDSPKQIQNASFSRLTANHPKSPDWHTDPTSLLVNCIDQVQYGNWQLCEYCMPYRVQAQDALMLTASQK